MKKTLIAFTVAALAAFTQTQAFAENNNNNNFGRDNGGRQDARFLQNAAQSAMAEVALGQLAATHAANADVKAYGQRMVTEHAADIAAVQALAAARGITLPTTLNVLQRFEQQRLTNLYGAAFDREYIISQIVAHELTIRLFTDEVESGNDFELRFFAADRLHGLLDHLQLATQIARTLGLQLPRD